MGTGRANDIITLPGGDLIYARVATQDSGGALFMTEQPIERGGRSSSDSRRRRIEQCFRDFEKRGEYFGNGSAEDKELVHRLYGIVNVGPLKP